MSSVPWFIKHKPNRFTELYFSDETHFKALEWLKNFKKGSLLHITGGCGTGKTSLVYSIAKALKYNVVEYSELKFESLKQINLARTLNNTPNLLLIDECDIQTVNILSKLASLDLPIILTSSALFIKDFTTLKIARPRSELIMNAAKSILQKEGRSLDNRVILALAETCNYDFRAVINYCQLFCNNTELKDLKIVEHVASTNIFSACKSILSKRMKMSVLETLYSQKIACQCLNSIVEAKETVNGLKCFESFSDISFLPEEYQFLVLDPLNQIRMEFVYKKEEAVNVSHKHGHEDCIHFLSAYKRNLQDKESILHLQKIFEVYKIEDLSAVDNEIKNFIDFTVIESRVFRYKFNLGASAAVKRDTTIKEIMDI